MVAQVVIKSEPTGPNAPAAVSPPAGTTPAVAGAPPADRPTWLPEKFKSPEELARAYGELETKLGQPKAEPVKVPAATEPPKVEVPPAQAPSAVAAQLETQGLSFDEFTAEFSKDGKLSDASYEKLTKAGYPKQVVDTWIDGQQARLELSMQRTYALTGGEEGFKSMIGWAAKSLPKADVAAYNAAVDSGDQAKANLAVTGLFAKYTEANGSQPNLIGGNQSGAIGGVYRSRAEMVADMSDPRYAKDPAFRKDVEQKLLRSNIL